MFSLRRKSLRKRVSDLEREVHYRELWIGGIEISTENAIVLIFKHLDIEVGLLKKDASKVI